MNRTETRAIGILLQDTRHTLKTWRISNLERLLKADSPLHGLRVLYVFRIPEAEPPFNIDTDLW
jgi:hypothetical protein